MKRGLFLLLAAALAVTGAVVPAGPAAAQTALVPETITAGIYHTCALDTAGKAWCWGDDAAGQVGDGPASQADKYAPVRVAGDRAYTTITAGGWHTCGLDTAGKAWCWGWDGGGAVGDGAASQADKYAPVRVAGDRAFTTISGGDIHTCALDTAGKAWCWGDDEYGQVGDGSANQTDKYAPVRVTGDRAYATINAGSLHSCALDTAGKAWCWGDDERGQVGDGAASQAVKYAPARVSGDRAYRTISGGGIHSCALDTAGKAWCWGDDGSGQVGDGSASQADKYAPVRVAGDRAYTTITGGSFHSCALDTAGKAWCWGDDSYGQVGDGSASQADKYAPVRVVGDRDYATITAGHQHTCALDTAGKARCWGRDAEGQTGGGPSNQDPKYASVPVAGGRTYLLPGR